MLTVTKIMKFDAAHFLPHYVGQCKNLHGHTWKVEVEVGYAENIEMINNSNFVVDFSILKKLMEIHVISIFDHRLLNEVIPNPTAETITLWVGDALAVPLANENCALKRVRVWESEDSYAEWKA